MEENPRFSFFCACVAGNQKLCYVFSLSFFFPSFLFPQEQKNSFSVSEVFVLFFLRSTFLLLNCGQSSNDFSYEDLLEDDELFFSKFFSSHIFFSSAFSRFGSFFFVFPGRQRSREMRVKRTTAEDSKRTICFCCQKKNNGKGEKYTKKKKKKKKKEK